MKPANYTHEFIPSAIYYKILNIKVLKYEHHFFLTSSAHLFKHCSLAAKTPAALSMYMSNKLLVEYLHEQAIRDTSDLLLST